MENPSICAGEGLRDAPCRRELARKVSAPLIYNRVVNTSVPAAFRPRASIGLSVGTKNASPGWEPKVDQHVSDLGAARGGGKPNGSRPFLIFEPAAKLTLPPNRPGWPNLAGRGMSFNICCGTLGSLAIFTEASDPRTVRLKRKRYECFMRAHFFAVSFSIFRRPF